MVDDFLGMDEVDDLSDAIQGDGTVNVMKKKKVPKLDLAKVREESKKGKYRFRCIGATRFAQIQQKIQKYESVLNQVIKSPQLAAITNVPVLWRKTLMAIEMEDIDEVLKTKDEIAKDQQQAMPPQGMPPAGPGGPAMPGNAPAPNMGMMK